MSISTLGAYKSYLPIFLVDGLKLVWGKKVNQNDPDIEILYHNGSRRSVTQFIIASLAYAVIFHIAPRLGYTIPSPVLWAAGVMFPKEATLLTQAYVGITSINKAAVQGYAGDLVKATKELSIATVAYVSTTYLIGEPKFKLYNRPLHSIAETVNRAVNCASAKYDLSDNVQAWLPYNRVRSITKTAVLALAYIGIFHIAPSLGYPIPQPVLLAAGLVFHEQAIKIIKICAVTNIMKAVAQGNLNNIPKDLSIAAATCFTIITDIEQLRERLYQRIIPHVKKKTQ